MSTQAIGGAEVGAPPAAATGVLLLGFGGPTPGCCGRRAACAQTPGCEAECFVSGILGDNPARAARVSEVAGHYRELGGFSAYNELTARQAAALAAELARRGRPLAVELGFRHWRPWSLDGVRALAARGVGRLALVVLAPHQSSVSWDWYLKHAAEAVEAAAIPAPGAAPSTATPPAPAPDIVAVAAPFWNAPGFISANVARLREATAGWDAARLAAAELIFTAHAIPRPVEETSPYRRQFAETARLVAEAFGHPAHALAFQSQPGDSRIPWSSPTIADAITAAHQAGKRDLLILAAGFLVDHTEVLYDLDHEARAHADRLGLTYTRARCVHDHPDFIATLADRVLAALDQAGKA
jgi:ferrochelatase